MNNLFQFNKPQLASFRLALKDSVDFECMEIVRCIPGKRLVSRGKWNGQAVYAKLFIGAGAKRYAERDKEGVQALIAARISTPPLLHTGGINTDGEILIFREIEQSINAEDAMDRLHSAHERLSLAQSLVKEVARHHNAGLIQQDLYLKNFLFDSSRVIYTLDGDGIRSLSKTSRKQALHNLAVLLSKFDAVEEAGWVLDLLQAYEQERGLSSPINLSQMQKEVADHRSDVARGYADKKVFRQCSDVEVEQRFNSFSAISRRYHGSDSQDFKDLLADPEPWLNNGKSRRLKSGNTCTVSLVEAGGRKIVVKRYNIKGMGHAVSRMWRPSRAAISWANAHRLQMYGIATAKPVAMKEERFGPLRFWAYFLAEYIPEPDIGSWMDSAAVNSQELAAVNVARLLYKMRLLQIAHGDLKASNIHIVNLQPVLIDLDSLQEYRLKAVFEGRHVSDLRRFMRNWEDKPEIHARMVKALKMVYGDDPILAKAGI